MIRLTSFIVLCLISSMAVGAGETSKKAYEVAETQLLAEWVGLPDQQHSLATTYYQGDGVPRDYTEAAKWYRKAADQGLAESQYMLGVMYDRGEGLSPDYFQAVKWYREAAGQGYVPAQFELGNEYATGKGVPQNYAEAYVWYSLAAAAGHEKARRERDSYARKLSNEEIMEAQRRAAGLFEKIQQGKTAD